MICRPLSTDEKKEKLAVEQIKMIQACCRKIYVCMSKVHLVPYRLKCLQMLNKDTAASVCHHRSHHTCMHTWTGALHRLISSPFLSFSHTYSRSSSSIICAHLMRLYPENHQQLHLSDMQKIKYFFPSDNQRGHFVSC